MREETEEEIEAAPNSHKLSILVTDGVAAGIRKLARRNRRTISAEASLALEEHLERAQAQAGTR